MMAAYDCRVCVRSDKASVSANVIARRFSFIRVEQLMIDCNRRPSLRTADSGQRTANQRTADS